MMLTNLAALAASTGYPVTEVEGWRTRTRPGEMIAVKTITIHETGLGHVPTTDMPSLNVLTRGRAKLSGPLSQFGIGVSGRIYVVAAGKCNHAGESLAARFNNPYAIGLELEASGLGLVGDFPPAQLDSAARLARALQLAFAGAVILGHKETCKPPGRKIDPHLSMDGFRTRVAGVNLARPPAATEDDPMTSPKDWDDHTLTAADAAKYGNPKLKGQSRSWSQLLREPPAVVQLRREHTAAIGALSGMISALSTRIGQPSPGLTVAQVEAAAARGAQLALEDLTRRQADEGADSA